jgi:hypothetical protein
MGGVLYSSLCPSALDSLDAFSIRSTFAMGDKSAFITYFMKVGVFTDDMAYSRPEEGSMMGGARRSIFDFTV